MNILLVKETRASETCVALIPSHVKQIIKSGHFVFVEQDAGKLAGFSDQDYQESGAEIRYLNANSVDGFQKLFENIDMIVRVKRPDRDREILENQSTSNILMIGALDSLEKNSPHIDEYHKANIHIISLDQLPLTKDDPMNILVPLSKMAGRMALLDAINRCQNEIKKIIIIGFGTAGCSAFEEAIKNKLPTEVILTNADFISDIEKKGGKAFLLNKNAPITEQQEAVKNKLLDADIIITSARMPNQPAPLLIPLATLNCMKENSIVVDLALSEGGNVEGSEHDASLILGNNVIVTNTSGYLKAMPTEASQLWSNAVFHFIIKVSQLFHTRR